MEEHEKTEEGKKGKEKTRRRAWLSLHDAVLSATFSESQNVTNLRLIPIQISGGNISRFCVTTDF